MSVVSGLEKRASQSLAGDSTILKPLTQSSSNSNEQTAEGEQQEATAQSPATKEDASNECRLNRKRLQEKKHRDSLNEKFSALANVIGLSSASRYNKGLILTTAVEFITTKEFLIHELEKCVAQKSKELRETREQVAYMGCGSFTQMDAEAALQKQVCKEVTRILCKKARTEEDGCPKSEERKRGKKRRKVAAS